MQLSLFNLLVRIPIRCVVLCLLFSAQPIFLQAQEPSDTTLFTLQPIVLDASRLESADARTPMAVSYLDASMIQAGNQQVSIHESLDPVPGLFAINQENYAQDLRISIRGFGARAAFGIRGIKVLVDGIPESTPDGQAQVDNLDMGIIDNLQVIRGPASGLYGNASGGVLLLKSEEPSSEEMLEGRITFGSYNLQRYQLKGSFGSDKFQGIVYGSHTQSNGYREHSEVRSTLLNAKLQYSPDSSSAFHILLNYVDSPTANDPGGVDSLTFTQAPRRARDRNLQFNSGEAVRQGRIALVYQNQLSSRSQIQARGYYLNRDFNNRLPFSFGGAVAINRNYAGGGISYQYTGAIGALPYRLKVGMDLDYQADNRQRFVNDDGETGNLTFDQLESFFSLGTYAINELYLSDAVNINLSLRYDQLSLEADDRFTSNGDDSGSLNFNQVNPALGIVFAPTDRLSFYGNIASSFETPTLSELSANPDGGGGFNPALEAQKALNYEIGMKGSAAERIRYTASFFLIRVFDELVPYELAAFPDREFFRNAGNSRRIGTELSLTALIAKGLEAAASYTYGNFVYTDYEANGTRFDDNRLPGIPASILYTGLRYRHQSGFLARAWLKQISSVYTNDRNTAQTDPYTLLNVRIARTFEVSWGLLEPFVGLNNLLDEQYPGNIRINAFGGRFFEAGAGINAFGGIRVRLN